MTARLVAHRVLTVALVATAGCGGAHAVRLVAGKSDTIVVNSRRRVELPVEGVDARGREVRLRDLRYRVVAGDPLPLSSDGHLQCTARGDAQVLASAGTLSRRFALLCRPIKALLFGGNLRMVVGGPPQAVPIEAFGTDDLPAAPLAGYLTVQDSEVADLRGDLVYPKARGATEVEIRIGDERTIAFVCVEERVKDPDELRPFTQFLVSPLRLAPGDVRSWPLPPGGWYELTLATDSGSRGSLVLGASAANCAHARSGAEHYFCIANHGAAVLVQNPEPAGSGQALSGSLSVRRILRDDEATTVAGRPARNGRRKLSCLAEL